MPPAAKPVESKAVYDGFTVLDGGMDGGRAASIIKPNQVSSAVNCTFRDDFIRSRPGVRRIPLVFPNDSGGAIQNAATKALFQGACGYIRQDDDGFSELIWWAAGRCFRCALNVNFNVDEITPPGNLNSAILPKVWMQQAEMFVVTQNGVDTAAIYDGNSSRRAGVGEVPTGTAMAYGMGHLWVANGNGYTAGAVVGDQNYGHAVYQYRDSILNWTQNSYLAGGGFFFTPYQTGDIMAMTFSANLDTTLGDGELLVFTQDCVFTTEVPPDRADWQSLTNPLQRVGLLKYGTNSDRSVTLVNGDTYYRREDGAGSFIYARREFKTTWGQTPLSGEVTPFMVSDNRLLSQFCSAGLFDNRFFLCVSPQQGQYGVYHTGIVTLDFAAVTSLHDPLDPIWEGAWTPFNTLQLIVIRVSGVERCFAFVHGETEIELWEITLDEIFDEPTDGDYSDISSVLESKVFDFGTPMQLKRLESFNIWYKFSGNISWKLSYRPDQYSCWQTWHEWTDCAPIKQCDPTTAHCPPIANLQKQYRKRQSAPRVEPVADPSTNTYFCDGFEFQIRLEWTGWAEIRKVRVGALMRPELEFNDIATEEECVAVDCCVPNDLNSV